MPVFNDFDGSVVEELLKQKELLYGASTAVPEEMKKNCSAEKIKESVSLLKQTEAIVPRYGDLFQVLGIPVHVVPDPPLVPKIQLSESCPVSDEFRAKANAWYIEMFGYKQQEPLIPTDTVLMTSSFGFITNERMAALLTNLGA